MFSLILVAISSTIFCKEPWQCDSLGKFNCANDQTCCRSKVSTTGWACFPSQNAVCCSDGLSCCPTSTICNLRDRRCDPKPQSFLQVLAEPVEPQEALLFLSDVSTIQPTDAIAFADGFNEGFTFFKNLAHKDECKPNDPQIIADISSIFEILKNVSIKDIITIVPQILEKAADAYQRISALSEGCKLYAEEIQKVSDALKAHMAKSGYYTNLTLHTVTNIGSITEKAKNGISQFQGNNFNQSGLALGDLIKFLLFWNFQ
jgi:hypothetical protein